jgi:hypothetical protein
VPLDGRARLERVVVIVLALLALASYPNSAHTLLAVALETLTGRRVGIAPDVTWSTYFFFLVVVDENPYGRWAT